MPVPNHECQMRHWCTKECLGVEAQSVMKPAKRRCKPTNRRVQGNELTRVLVTCVKAVKRCCPP
ncbi:hypothetical protein HAX54_045119, partial [Datura stramonium]|nr:hypothetical protein [Datura stramonium]